MGRDSSDVPASVSAGSSASTAWWRNAVVYQVYPRSFADANGDGIGDLRRPVASCATCVELGVDAVWLSPFYPSPQADGGYDVADYRDVDPVFGTLDDFEALIAEAHDLGLRVIVDLVPNHTSDQHPWFQAALAAGRAARSGSDTCSATGAARTAPSRRTTGSRASAARPGRAVATGSGICTCSPRSRPT